MSYHAERKSQHILAKKYMELGRYAEAETVLINSVQMLGPHVGLLSDLVVIYYWQNKIDLFEKTFEKLEFEFETAKSKLSKESFIKTSVILAKFHEEMCHVDKAISYYNQALKMAEKIETQKKIQIQKLRLLASLGPSVMLSKIYSECNRVQDYPQHLKIELMHGLMLAEIHLLGLKAGHEKLLKTLDILSPDDDMDRRLVVGDYLEQELIICKKTQLSDTLISTLKSGDVFEKSLYRLAIGKTEFDSAIQDELTKMSWFRIAALSIHLSDFQKNQELINKFHLLLNSVPASNHKTLRSKWPFIWKSDSLKEITLDTHHVYYENRKLAIGRKNNLKLTVSFFSEKSEATLKDFVEKVLHENHDSYSFDQVRMIFSRIQKDFTKDLGIFFPIFQINKNKVWKSDQVIIRKI